VFSFDWEGWEDTQPSTLLNVSITDNNTAATVFSQSYAYNSALSHETDTFTGSGDSLRLEVQESPESGGNDNQFIVDNFSVLAVPEPSTLALAGVAGIAAFIVKRRQK
jgi:hypothetical protein